MYIFFLEIGIVRYGSTSICLLGLTKNFKIISATNKYMKKKLNVSIGAKLGSIAKNILSRNNPNMKEIVKEKKKIIILINLAASKSSNNGLRQIERK